MQIVTGRRGEPHVTSRQMQAVYRSFLGDFALLDVGNHLAATATASDNVRISDGVVAVQGIYAVIAYNEYDDSYIEPVSVGMKRIDTLILHYTKSNDIEDMQIEVVEGEEVVDNPVAPTIAEGGDAWEGTADIKVPIYDVLVTSFGLTVTPYSRMNTLIPTLDSIAERIPESIVTGVKGDSEALYRNGNVNITKDNIGLGNVDNTADTNKPVSNATQTALNLKADLTYVDAKIAAAYHAGGSKTVEELTSALLIADNMGKVYNMSDSGVTTADFVEGAGDPINEGDNVGICNVGTEESPIYKFDLLSGFVDLSAYATKGYVDGSYTIAGKSENTTLGTRATAEGEDNTVTGTNAHGEGYGNTASGSSSHAEGIGNTASNAASHTEGTGNTVSGQNSHAEGIGNVVSSNTSHVEGMNNIVSSANQHVSGKYNVADSNGRYAEIVGGGTPNARKNIRTLDWQGNAVYAGDVTINGDKSIANSLSELTQKANPYSINQQARDMATPQYMVDDINGFSSLSIFVGGEEVEFVDIAYNISDGLYYCVDTEGGLWSVDSNDGGLNADGSNWTKYDNVPNLKCITIVHKYEDGGEEVLFVGYGPTGIAITDEPSFGEWTTISGCTDNNFAKLYTQGSTVYFVSDLTIQRSDDMGRSWVEEKSGDFVDATFGGGMLSVLTDEKIYTKNITESTWNEWVIPSSDYNRIIYGNGLLVISASSEQSYGVCISKDGGKTWEDKSYIDNNGFSEIFVGRNVRYANGMFFNPNGVGGIKYSYDLTKVHSFKNTGSYSLPSLNGSYELAGNDSYLWTKPSNGNPVEYARCKVTRDITGIINNKVDKVTGKGLSTNDYTTVEKNKLAGISSGATQTIANPQGISTDTLNTISIDGVIYDIEGGGGGSGSFTETTLYQSDTNESVYNLSDDISNYDLLYLEGGYNASGNELRSTAVLSVVDVIDGIADGKQYGISNDAYFTYVKPISNVQFIRGTYQDKMFLHKIIGIKFGSGGGASNLSDLSDVELSNLSDGQILQYNSTTEKWENTDSGISNSVTATGNPLTIQSSESNLVECVAEVEAIQDLHGYDHPWVGGAGKNKLRMSDKTFQGADTYFAEWSYNSGMDNAVELQAGVTYTLSFDITCNNMPCYVSVGTGNGYYSLDIAQVEITENGRAYITFTPTNESFIYGNILAFRAPRYNSPATYSGTLKNIMLEVGSSPTTFAPYSNICPITGQTEVVIDDVGVNQWDEEWETGAFDENSGNPIISTGTIRSKNYIPIFPDTAYYFKNGGVDGFARCVFYDGSKNIIAIRNNIIHNGTVFTSPSNARFMRFNMASIYGATYNNDISINSPSTDTDYHAYKGKTYTIQLGDTIYGGELDVITGELTVTHGEVDLGSLNWQYSSSYASFVSNNISDMYNVDTSDYSRGLVCSSYQAVNYWWTDPLKPDYSVSHGSPKNVIIKDSSYSDATTFKTAVTGQTLVYELAEPFIIDLTPEQIRLLKGTNNISCNTGDLSIKYYPDNVLGQLKGDIEKGLNAYYDYQIQALWDKINELQA